MNSLLASETSIMSAVELDDPAAPLPRLPSTSPVPAGTEMVLDDTGAEYAAAADGNNIIAGGSHTIAEADPAKDNGTTQVDIKTYSIYDYFGIQYDDYDQLQIVFGCPHFDTQCDGFDFSSIQECLDHERDWHAGPYKCFICGQIFASDTRLQRHVHYNDSKERQEEVDAAEIRMRGLKVYTGNEPARRRARTLAKLIKREESENIKKHAREYKKRERSTMKDVKKEMARKRKKDGPLVVIGAEDGFAVAEQDGEHGMQSCGEPCCSFFERFLNNAAFKRHIKSQGHLVAVRMGEALLQHFTTTAMGKTSFHESPPQDVEMSGCRSHRASTPPSDPIDAQTQLLSPPPTPNGGAPATEEVEEDWDGAERAPLQLELRLAKTQKVLRELRCNAPGCSLYGRQVASAQRYWGHLATEGHQLALRAWTGRGGEAVYVRF